MTILSSSSWPLVSHIFLAGKYSHASTTSRLTFYRPSCKSEERASWCRFFSAPFFWTWNIVLVGWPGPPAPLSRTFSRSIWSDEIWCRNARWPDGVKWEVDALVPSEVGAIGCFCVLSCLKTDSWNPVDRELEEGDINMSIPPLRPGSNQSPLEVPWVCCNPFLWYLRFDLWGCPWSIRSTVDLDRWQSYRSRLAATVILWWSMSVHTLKRPLCKRAPK